MSLNSWIALVSVAAYHQTSSMDPKRDDRVELRHFRKAGGTLHFYFLVKRKN